LGKPALVSAFYAGALALEHEEVALRAVLAASLGADGDYVDVGTNRGQLLREALRIAPRGNHLAFEPIPALAQEIRREFPGVECRELAIGARPGVEQFCYFRTLDGWSGLRRSPEVSDKQGHPEYISVEVSTLDEQLRDRQPAVVKIDVEGAELDVLRGGRALLERARPLLIVEHVSSAASLYGVASGEVWTELDKLSYELFAITGEGPFTRSQFADSAGVVNWLAKPIS
jgi:FkbM family methyltransferase